MNRLILVLSVLAASLSLSLASEPGLQQSFESRSTLFQAGAADAPFQELQHDLSAATAHTGQKSEHIRIQAEQGTYVYYAYPVGRAMLFDDFKAKVWVKANRPGTQLLVRLVLPKERDAKQLDQPLTTLLRGDTYQLAGRWDQLQLQAPLKKLDEQKQLLRAEFGRDLNFEGAFVDQVLLNVLGGPGLNEVWIDDLEVSPVVGAALDAKTNAFATSLPRTPTANGAAAGASPTPRDAVIELNQDRLLVNKQPFLLRGVRHAGSSLKTLRTAGFNTLWVEGMPEPKTLNEALSLGFWLVPNLQAVGQERGKPEQWLAAADLTARVKAYPQPEAVLCWQVGANLTAEAADATEQAVRAIRNADPNQGRPVGAALWDGFRPYGRQLDMQGVHRWPLYTGLELDEYWDWLESRGNLAGSNLYVWTWVQTHFPEWLQDRMKDQASPGSELHAKLAEQPPEPSPEQIRLLTYLSLGAGCRGLAYWLDRPLTEEPGDKIRFLSLALLNQELQLLEPMLAAVKQCTWTTPDPKRPELRLALFRFDGGMLAVPIWMGKGSQHVPGQLAENNLTLVVPGAPQDGQAWEVNPTVVRPLRRERVPGGMRIVLPEFGLNAVVLFTSDFGLVGKLQQSIAATSRKAAQWSYDLAYDQLAKVERIDKQLAEIGHPEGSSSALLGDARKHLQEAQAAWQRGGVTDYRIAYEASQRALRPLRLLMRAHWQRAVGGVDAPICSPYAVCFETLPAHYRMVSDVRASQSLPNLLQHGQFEEAMSQTVPGWSLQQTTLDGVSLRAERVAEDPKEGKQCLKLEIAPGDGHARPVALERTFLALHSPPVQLKPGTLVRISGWIKIPQPIVATNDGVLFFDSCGGDPLALRLKGKTPWRQFSLYRRVPASGEISVTLGLTGLGVACFDDVRIEPLVAPQPAASASAAAPPGGTKAKIEFDQP